MADTLIIGTAGHVDHGKTSLIKALTGIDLDRDPEEKRRGLTINAGYASLEMDSGLVFFVDVPGHQAYLRNTIRGLWGVETAILVIAADEGVMPQTREHLAVLEILGVSKGIVVLTRVDLADEEVLCMAEDEARDLVRGTFLEAAPVIRFSARTGLGKAEVKTAIKGLLSSALHRNVDRPFMMPVDQVFTVDGYGTVVTGSVASGRIHTGSMVEICPGKRQDQVRLLQAGGKPVEAVRAGMRAGINLRLTGHGQIARGMVLGGPGCLREGRFVNLELHLLDHLREPLKNHAVVRVFCGSSHAMARLVLMEGEVLLPGRKALCQLRFKGDIAALPLFPLVISSLSPVRILGGGPILEISRRKWRKKYREKAGYLKLLSSGRLGDIVVAILKNSPGRPVDPAEIAITSGHSLVDMEREIRALLNKRELLYVGQRVYLYRYFKEITDNAIRAVSTYNCQRHEFPGMPIEEIRSKFPVSDEGLKDALIEALKADEGLETARGDRLCMAGFKPFLPNRLEGISRKVISFLESREPRPVTFSDLKGLDSVTEADLRRVVSFLFHNGKIVRIFKSHRGNREEYITTGYLEKIKERISRHIMLHGRLTFEDTATVIPIGRLRFNILDYLDSIRFTIRSPDMSRTLDTGHKHRK